MATYSGQQYIPDWRLLLVFAAAMAAIATVSSGLAWAERGNIGTEHWAGFLASITIATSTLTLAVISAVDSYNWSPLGQGLGGEPMLEAVTYWSATVCGLLILATMAALLPSIRRLAAAREAALWAQIHAQAND
jgi:hypothetical protein